MTARVSVHPGSDGGTVEFVLGGAVLPVTLHSTGAWDKYQTITVGTLPVPAGESKLVVRVKDKKGEAPCNLGEVRLEPVKK